MKIFKTLLNDNKLVGLSSLGLSTKKSTSIFKNNYNDTLFKMNVDCPVIRPDFLIDQTLYRLS